MATDLVSPLPPLSPSDSSPPAPETASTPVDSSYLYNIPFAMHLSNPLPSNMHPNTPSQISPLAWLGAGPVAFHLDDSMVLDGNTPIQDPLTQSNAVNSATGTTTTPTSTPSVSPVTSTLPTAQDGLADYKNWLTNTPHPPPLAPRAQRPRPEELEPLHPSKIGLSTNLNYNIAQLKQFASEYKLRRTGNKGVLRQRLHAHLVRSWHATRIQAVYRGHLFRRYLRTKGLLTPARPNNTTNDEELETLEPVSGIPLDRLYVISNAGGMPTVYDVDVLRKLLRTQREREKTPYDPYTNVPFAQGDLERLQEEGRLKGLLGRGGVKAGSVAGGSVTDIQPAVVINPEAVAANMFRLRIIGLCSQLDSLGHITNPSWFFDLGTEGWRRLCVELSDIWGYRAQLSQDIKARVAGDFRVPIPSRTISNAVIRHRALNQAERMVYRGVDRDSKMLGANYLLIALTLVSPEAAEALPWLYQAGRLS